MAACVSEVMNIYDKVHNDQLKYCCVCLRTEAERRLGRPRAFEEFAEHYNCGFKFTAHLWVCYICETHAASAVRFVRAVNFAYAVHSLYGDMSKKKKYEREVKEHFNKVKVNMRKFHSMDNWEEQLEDVRAQSQLMQTEVLVIDTLRRQLKVDGERRRPHSTMDGQLEVILVDDDEDEGIMSYPPSAVHNSKEIEVLGPGVGGGERAKRKSSEQMNSNYFSTPESPERKSPRISVRNLMPQIQIPEFPKSEPVETTLPDAPATDLLLAPEPSTLASYVLTKEAGSHNLLLHPVVARAGGALSVPTLSAAFIHGELVPDVRLPAPPPPGPSGATATDGPPVVVDGTCRPVAPHISVQNTASTINVVTESDQDDGCFLVMETLLAEKLSEIENVKKRGSGLPPPGAMRKVGRQEHAGDDDAHKVKLPVKNTDRIDWEDKIPMDVISFVETPPPPDPARCAAPGLGVISDVRSLPPAPPTPADLIDLC